MIKNSSPNAGLQRIGANIRDLRKALKWTQEDLSKRASISRIALIHIESGRALPTLETLVSVAEVLNVSVARLLGSANEMPPAGTLPSKKTVERSPDEPLEPEAIVEIENVRKLLSTMEPHQLRVLSHVVRVLLQTWNGN